MQSEKTRLQVRATCPSTFATCRRTHATLNNIFLGVIVEFKVADSLMSSEGWVSVSSSPSVAPLLDSYHLMLVIRGFRTSAEWQQNKSQRNGRLTDRLRFPLSEEQLWEQQLTARLVGWSECILHQYWINTCQWELLHALSVTATVLIHWRVSHWTMRRVQ